jgi:hypothetical protein
MQLVSGTSLEAPGVSPWTDLLNGSILAQVDLSELSKHMVEGADFPTGLFVMLVGGIVVLLTGIALVRRLRQGPPEPHPLQIFSRIAGEVGLSWPQRLLLVRIAHDAKLTTPLSLLLASGTLQHFGRQYAAGLSAGRRKRVFRTLARIQRQCFENDENHPAEPDKSPYPNREPTGTDEPYAPKDTIHVQSSRSHAPAAGMHG